MWCQNVFSTVVWLYFIITFFKKVGELYLTLLSIIKGALALIHLGAHGATFDELSTAMGLASGVDVRSRPRMVHRQLGRILSRLRSEGDLRATSALFVQNGFPIRRAYQEASAALYGSEVFNLDFRSDPGRARDVINTWVFERTAGKIRKIVEQPPPASTRVIVASALYFKNEWERPFFQGGTRL